MKDLIDQIIAQEFEAPDLEFSWSAEPSIDPQAQEAILSSYATKGIITINEARAALGHDPFPDTAANTPMTLTGGGYVALGAGTGDDISKSFAVSRIHKSAGWDAKISIRVGLRISRSSGRGIRAKWQRTGVVIGKNCSCR